MPSPVVTGEGMGPRAKSPRKQVLGLAEDEKPTLWTPTVVVPGQAEPAPVADAAEAGHVHAAAVLPHRIKSNNGELPLEVGMPLAEDEEVFELGGFEITTLDLDKNVPRGNALVEVQKFESNLLPSASRDREVLRGDIFVHPVVLPSPDHLLQGTRVVESEGEGGRGFYGLRNLFLHQHLNPLPTEVLVGLDPLEVAVGSTLVLELLPNQLHDLDECPEASKKLILRLASCILCHAELSSIPYTDLERKQNLNTVLRGLFRRKADIKELRVFYHQNCKKVKGRCTKQKSHFLQGF